MSLPNRHIRDTANAFRNRANATAEHVKLPPRIPGSADHSAAAVERRRSLLSEQGIHTDILYANDGYLPADALAGNIENLIGFARVPVGVIGPLRIRGAHAQGDFYVPLATTEGAMLASYQRGSQAISRSGGATAICIAESVSRSPGFVFDRISEAGAFVAWAVDQYDRFQQVVETTSRHCQLVDMRAQIAGKEVYLVFEFKTGDASGQNMVTIATDAICNRLVADAPFQPQHWFLEANASGDKKASMLGLFHHRGKKVLADVEIDRKTCQRFLHTTPEKMNKYWSTSVIGAIQTGAIGVQGHYANALAGLFIATGQDVACVSEAHIGITRIDVTPEGGLYMSVCLPNLIVGTVGGGTRLPTQRECLEMIGCFGDGKARKFAEICAATVLAGELSIVAALCAGHFAQAHATYGRQSTSKPSSLDVPSPHFSATSKVAK